MTALGKSTGLNKAPGLLATLTTAHLVNDFNALILPFLLPTLIEIFGLSFLEAGILGMSTTLLPAVLNPTMGFLADKYGKRKLVILVGFASAAVGLIVVAYASVYAMVLFGFFVQSIGMSTFHAQSTNYITTTFGDAKGRAMGIHGMGGSVGNFTVPLLVTFMLTSYALRDTVFVLAIPSIIVIILVVKILPELSVPAQNQRLSAIRIARPLWILALCIGFLSMMYRSVLTFLPTYLVQIDFSLSQAGLISTLMLFIGFLAQPLGGYAFDKVGGRVLYAACAVLAGTMLILFTILSGVFQLVALVLFGASVLALFPVSLAMSGELAKGEMIGMKTGFVFGLSALMSSITPPLTGFLADSFGLVESLRWLAIFAVALFFTALFLPNRVERN